MSTGALALVLTAAVAHALWNLAAKRVVADRVVFVWLYVVGSAVLWVPLALVGAVATGQRPTWAWLLGAGVSALLHVVYNLVLVHGYAAGDLNLVYPLARGVGPLLVLVVAVGLLGESPGPMALAGAGLVVLGVLVMTLGGAAGDRRGAGVAWGALTGVTIASYTLWDHHAVTDLAVPPLTYFCLGLLLQAVPLTASVVSSAGRRAQIRPVLSRHRREVFAVAVLSPLAYVLVLQALTVAPVSLVAPLRESSIAVGALLGWWLLGGPRSCSAASPCSAWPDAPAAHSTLVSGRSPCRLSTRRAPTVPSGRCRRSAGHRTDSSAKAWLNARRQMRLSSSSSSAPVTCGSWPGIRSRRAWSRRWRVSTLSGPPISSAACSVNDPIGPSL